MLVINRHALKCPNMKKVRHWPDALVPHKLTGPRIAAFLLCLLSLAMAPKQKTDGLTVEQGVFVVPDVSIKELLDAIP